GARSRRVGRDFSDRLFERVPVVRQLQRDPWQRGEQAVEVGFDVLGYAEIHPQRLEQPVAEAEARIVGGDLHLGAGDEPAVPPGEMVDSRGAQSNSSPPIAVRKAAAFASLSSRSRSGSESAVMPHPAW